LGIRGARSAGEADGAVNRTSALASAAVVIPAAVTSAAAVIPAAATSAAAVIPGAVTSAAATVVDSVVDSEKMAPRLVSEPRGRPGIPRSIREALSYLPLATA
jgi:hypothetical protein